MVINFKKVILHNFLSYAHSEIDLENKGYCLVNGINNFKKDNATSNGSGKSSWISAICYALTGETIQGVKSDLKNIYIDEDLCYVKLIFDYNKDTFEITRYNKPKSDLKILVNGEDKSGKGIREGEVVLANYLHDVDKNLITSVILLGQGLPNKLSSHSPSGRKELLEKLAKTDFMIEDIKERVANRSKVLNDKLRNIEDNILLLNTQIRINSNNLEKLKEECEIKSKIDNREKIESLNSEINSLQAILDTLNGEVEERQEKVVKVSDFVNKLKLDQSNELTLELTNYNTKFNEINSKKFVNTNNISNIKKEIEKINNIQDVCPLCHRPFENVVKPSTKDLEESLALFMKEKEDIEKELKECNDKHDIYVKEIKASCSLDIDKNTKILNEMNNEFNTLKTKIKDTTTSLNVKSNELNKLVVEQNSLTQALNKLQNDIEELNKEVENDTLKIKEIEEEKINVNCHLDIIKKMESLIKRDFRGYLLTNVISHINTKAKEYCIEIFGTNEIEFNLDGNDIEIKYANKPFESLSGGEKQKVDLIMQFSIRSLLSNYLNFSSNILCLDEIFDNLDTKSTNNVLNMLANKLNDIESVFIISHHSDELQIPNDTELTIIKNEEGISEVK